jgi:hypothetical protein
MGASKTFKSRRNCPSRLLSNEENTQLNEIIGAQCKVRITAFKNLLLLVIVNVSFVERCHHCCPALFARAT